jgi:hypothetical protein
MAGSSSRPQSMALPPTSSSRDSANISPDSGRIRSSSTSIFGGNGSVDAW